MTADSLLTFDEFSNIINGELRKTKQARYSINPSTLEHNPPVPVSSLDDVDEAVGHARNAFKSWSKIPLSARREAVVALAAGLHSLKSDFAHLLVREQGKPLWAAENEIDAACHWLKVQAELPFSEDVILETDERIIKTRYTPLGVAVALVPWNSCGKIAPALVTGNTLIVKPSQVPSNAGDPFTPYCDLKLVELAQRFFPPGVLQCLSGDDNLGPWLTTHEGINKVSFTGSTATGKLVMQSCANTLKRVTLELGGNDAAIICEDVDIRGTAKKVAELAFSNSGQVCVAIKRVYVHSSIYDEFLRNIVDITTSMGVGDGLAENLSLGPLQNAMQYDRVIGLLKDIKTTGLDIPTGEPIPKYPKGNGYFIRPTIVNNPPQNSRIVREEPFGPVVPLLKWDTEEQVLGYANDSEMGLSASVWTRDPVRAERIALQLEAGTVWVNSHLELRPDAAFGGHKQSGLGAEWGQEGMKSYCNTQTLFLSKK
ncbi:unnamed protein product [Clonostachys rosea]|uniref:aldehyde dehydrogenase (NAD(+)) n=1 Tax=Bionectria ochroleuca TaxID=29856 RepID=A0ABY6UGP6_BIOOC|nr:unnamed protein product [Clonostachys rosea]